MTRRHIHIHDGWLERLHPRKKSGEFTSGGQGESSGAGASSETGQSPPLRAAKQEKGPGLQPSAFPIVDLPEEKKIALRLEAWERAIKGTGPKPVEMSLPLSKLASFQESVEKRKVKAMVNKFGKEEALNAHPDKPRVIKIGNKYVLTDGNHRANAALLSGHKELLVNYYGDLTDLV
jgi:hypothetical protein